MRLTCAPRTTGTPQAVGSVRNLIGMRPTEGSGHLLRFILKGASAAFPNVLLGLLLRWTSDVNPLDLGTFRLACRVISEHMWPVLRTCVFIFMRVMLRAYLKRGEKKKNVVLGSAALARFSTFCTTTWLHRLGSFTLLSSSREEHPHSPTPPHPPNAVCQRVASVWKHTSLPGRWWFPRPYCPTSQTAFQGFGLLRRRSSRLLASYQTGLSVRNTSSNAGQYFGFFQATPVLSVSTSRPMDLL